MANDNVQTMIERYRRELIEFNKRNPQKKNGNSQLNDMKSKAVEAVMEEKDEKNRYIPQTQKNGQWADEQPLNERQMNELRENERQRNELRENEWQMNGQRTDEQQLNWQLINGLPLKDRQMDRQQMNQMQDEPSDYDTASEYKNSKLYVELNASDNNADGSDNNHRSLERIRPETGLTRLETESVMAISDAVMNEAPAAAKPGEATVQNPETTAPRSPVFEKNAADFPPYSSGNAKTYNNLEAFLKENSKSGSLRVQAAAAEQSFPVSNAEVLVTKKFTEGTHVFYKLFTDISGVALGMTLPAPDKALTAYPSALSPYATYDITVSHPKYVTVILRNCAIFDGIETIQFCEMVPKVGSTEQATLYEENPVTE